MKMVAGAVNPGRPVANLYVRHHQFLGYGFRFLMGGPSSLCGATTLSLVPLALLRI